MAYSTPRTWVAGEYPTAAQFNANVRDNVSFLANPPACRVHHSVAQSIAHDIDVLVAFNSERYDTNTMHDTATNNSRITINTAGLYVVSFTGEFVGGITYTKMYSYIRLNGTTPIGVSAGGSGLAANFTNVTTIWKFAAADYIQVMVRQAHAGATAQNLNASANYSPEFSATWIGLG